jgi:predicted dienelactone hydrolase
MRVATIGLRVAVVAVAAVSVSPSARAAAYDPLARGAAPTRADLVVDDAARRRTIPLRLYLPSATASAPVVLFSHGLGGSRENNPYLGEHWGARGYVVVFLQHAWSDESVWKDAPARERRGAMEAAASARNFVLRVEDVRAVLDQLARWNRAAGHALSGRLDLSRVGMSGHSFGAVTTQAVSGQSYGRAGTRFTDTRIRAALAMSPSAPRRGDAKEAFGAVAIPWMLMTGTKDEAVIGDSDVVSRLRVFPNLPPGDKYELVLADAEHSAFGERPLPGERAPRNPNHHRAILALSTAFWDACLRGDTAARAWLEGPGPRSVLEERDRFQLK